MEDKDNTNNSGTYICLATLQDALGYNVTIAFLQDHLELLRLRGLNREKTRSKKKQFILNVFFVDSMIFFYLVINQPYRFFVTHFECLVQVRVFALNFSFRTYTYLLTPSVYIIQHE